MRLVRRVLQEHRRVVVPLLGAFILNALIYGFAVRPLERSVANVEQSTAAAVKGLAAAQAEHAKASGTLTGKDRASKELATFYSNVLAQDLPGARRLTYGRLNRLAQQSHLEYRHASYEPVEDRDTTLTKLKTRVELSGSYPNMRSFIHAIETAPEFVVIDHIELDERGDQAGALRLTMDLSTYFRRAAR